MACERYRDTLSDVAAGASASADLEAHIASCASCRQERHALRQALATVDAELAGLRAAEPSPDLAARIRTAVAMSSEATPAWRLGWLWTLTAAAAALLVALALIGQRVSRTVPGAAATGVGPEASGEAALATPARDGVPGTASQSARLSNSSREAVSRSAPASPAALGALAPPSRRTRSEPEVLVPAGEAETLLRFVANLRRRTVTAESLLVADLSAPLPEPKGVFIRPLEIVPLDPEETSGAE